MSFSIYISPILALLVFVLIYRILILSKRIRQNTLMTEVKINVLNEKFNSKDKE